ncbi:MAG: ISL3 family transposase [Pseudomonadota bacterium]
MQINYILNRIQKHNGFVYGQARLRKKRTQMILEIEIRPRQNSHPICSGCEKKGPGYDTLPVRWFQFVPLWGMAAFFLYGLRRVDCPRCGVKVERVPWAQGKNHMTTTLAWFLARWAKRLSWKETAEAFQTTWDNVFRSVKMAVAWGLTHRNLENVTAIGIDEISWGKGPKYLTLVYQINAGCRRLLWIGRERTQKTLRAFFEDFGQEAAARLRFICSDMWKPYLRIVAELAGQAVHILDRFHIMSQVGKAIDKVRAQEVKQLKAKGEEPVLTHSRWCFLKRPENLSDKQTVKLKELLALNLKTVRAYLLKEDLQRFWSYTTPGWAGRFLDEWCQRTLRSRIDPMKKVAKMLRNHRGLLLNWFRVKDRIALGAVEGFNNKAKLTTKKAYGFRSYEVVKIALYHTLGDLPQPTVTHKFC